MNMCNTCTYLVLIYAYMFTCTYLDSICTVHRVNVLNPKICTCMKVSTENTAVPKFTKSRTSSSSVQIQITPKSQFEFVPRDTEKFEWFGRFWECSICSGNCHIYIDFQSVHVKLGVHVRVYYVVKGWSIFTLKRKGICIHIYMYL